MPGRSLAIVTDARLRMPAEHNGKKARMRDTLMLVGALRQDDIPDVLVESLARVLVRQHSTPPAGPRAR